MLENDFTISHTTNRHYQLDKIRYKQDTIVLFRYIRGVIGLEIITLYHILTSIGVSDASCSVNLA